MKPTTCIHCQGGHRPEWRSETREWCHRRSPVTGTGAFSITICTDPPDAPDGGEVRRWNPPSGPYGDQAA